MDSRPNALNNGVLTPESKYHIPGSEHVYYVPNFVTEEEENYLIRKIKDSPRQKWKQLANRRLQVWGGEITARQVLFAQEMPPFVTTYPDILARLRCTGAFQSSPHGMPNHVIMNEYEKGSGIMPHQDGPAYHPVVGTISLGSHTVFHYYQYRSEATQPATEGRSIDPIPILSILLEPRSLVVTTSSFYTSNLHGIDPLEEDVFQDGKANTGPILANLRTQTDMGIVGENISEYQKITKEGGKLERSTRYSLTCRDVAKVATVKSLLKR